jgi:hypothetical protein
LSVVREANVAALAIRSPTDKGLTPLVIAWKKFLDPCFSLLATSETIPTATRHASSEHMKLLTKIVNISQLDYPHFYEVGRTKEENPIFSKARHEEDNRIF